MKSRDEQMGIIIKTIGLLFSLIGVKTQEAVQLLSEKVAPKISLYKNSLIILILSTLILPVIFIMVVLYGSSDMTALVGSISFVLTLCLLLLISPFGILAEVVFGGMHGSATRYADIGKKILLVELCVVLFAWIVPIKNNPGYVFPLIVTAVVLGALGAHIFSRKVIIIVLTIVFLFILRAFFFPESSKELLKFIPWMDQKVKESVSDFTAPGGLSPGQKVKDSVTHRTTSSTPSSPSPGRKGRENDPHFPLASNPSGCKVYVGGHDRGSTPDLQVSKSDIDRGTVVMKPGYKPRIISSTDIKDGKINIHLEPGNMERTHKAVVIANTDNGDVYRYIQDKLGYSIDGSKDKKDLVKKSMRENVNENVLFAVLNAREGIDALIEVNENIRNISTKQGSFGYEDIGRSFGNIKLAQRVVNIKVTDFVTGKINTYKIEYDPQRAD